MKMLRGIFLLLCMMSTVLQAQVLNPVTWNHTVKDKGNNVYEISLNAKLEQGWHIYSVTQGEGGIGIPTSLTWTPGSHYELQGRLTERGKLLNVYSELIDANEKYYASNASFVQDIKVKANGTVEVEIMYQVCDDEKCLPPDYKEFSIPVTFKSATTSTAATTTEPEPEATTPSGPSLPAPALDAYTPSDTLASAGDISPSDTVTLDDSAGQEGLGIVTSPDDDASSQDQKKSRQRALFEIFIFGFLGGIAALLMPCIFPMIPLTVSMFTKQSKTRGTGITKAIIYGISIIVIYVSLGLVITLIFGPGALNAFATNPYVNIVFFMLFIVFALSFFGMFEITLPSKWVNRADKQADRSGYIGIFFMALTLVLVSFSCTGPIIGTLLVESATTGAMLGPAMGMFGFSLALALPFTLFAIFPGMLNSLPSSGGWLNTVKVSLGFIELAFALKFLSNADLVWQAGWLERELFIAIWIGIFFVMGMYLLNVFRMSHDSETGKIGTPRLLFALLTFAAVFYMLPGMWGAPLKLLSGLTPPKNYSEAPTGFFASAGGGALQQELPPNAHYGPHQIPAFYDIDDAVAYANSVNKPVFIDFTGDACANCRKVEDNVWVDPRVRKILSEDVVLASLYVDRFIDLPEDEKVFSEEKGRKLRTIGDKWSAYQIKHFRSNSQPLYSIVDENLNRYNEPMGAELNIEKYIKWLEQGIQNFHNKNIVSPPVE